MSMQEEVEVDRFDLENFSFTVERIGEKYFLVVRRKWKR
jgi:hypothetical protein